jgi:hypothetical protein
MCKVKKAQADEDEDGECGNRKVERGTMASVRHNDDY